MGLFEDLEISTVELGGLYEDYGVTLRDERDHKMAGWNQSRESSVSGRQMDADFYAVNYSKVALETQFRIKALEMQRDFIMYLIDHGFTDYPTRGGGPTHG